MSEKVISILAISATILIGLYFLILAAERIQSLVRAGKKKVLLTDGLHKYMAGLCLVSFVGTIVLLAVQAFRLPQFATLDSIEAVMHYSTVSTLLLCGAIGCMLLSGMVHTEYSIPGLQFGAYGVLIVAMILRVMMQTLEKPGVRILTLLYIVAFSMAIPVVYPSEVKHKKAFHIIESIVSVVLVGAFTIMLFQLFMGKYAWVFHPMFLVMAIIGDGLVLALRWKEEINWFVLVSLAISIFLWIGSAVAYLAG